VLAPTSKDARLAETVFTQAGIACVCCPTIQRLCEELAEGAAVVLLPEEVLGQGESNCLAEWLSAQPPWSDLPVLVMSRPGADSSGIARAMELFGNVTVLERPMRVASLVSTVRTALRARLRQYQIREYLTEREQAEAALREDDRRKDEFLAILAHELRNPLAPISNALALLEQSGENVDAAPVRDMMVRQVRHLVRLVDDLMEVSRITRGKIELRPEWVDVAAVARTAVETSRPLIHAGRHQLSITVPQEPLLVRGDPVRLAQVIANLLNNAAKFSGEAGNISLEIWRDGDSVAIAVRDGGMGIPPDMLARVFDLFAQVQQGAFGGLGIGLTLVKRLVELHGGSVSAFSEGVGRGSEFVVNLPLGARDARIAEEVPVKAMPAPRQGSRRILVVDDNRDAADTLAAVLRLNGTEVRVAYGGVSALEVVEDFRPTIVLLDLGMPEMDGFAVARRIREKPESGNIVIVALTGLGQKADFERSIAAGFDSHLTKPADIRLLEALLRSLETSTLRAAG
jgi:signal transduction histidine kinase/ActR/RegA family two-component response regulator